MTLRGPAPAGVLIPPGTYLAYPEIKLSGPCKGAMEFKATGATLKAPPEMAKFTTDTWFGFRYIDKLTLIGGTFDGQGQQTWKSFKCSDALANCHIPINLRFSSVTNSVIKDITSANSKYFHINLLSCNNTRVDNITVVAPGNSVNTDGIHIGRLINLNITNSRIGTGDDCISFGDGSKNVRLEKVSCGPGHGISVGSLGKYPNEGPVQGIYVKNCTVTGTDNGVRIKTWPNAYPGSATDVHFEDIIVKKVANPIFIDQDYCPSYTCTKGGSSKVKLTNITFKNIKGTSTTKVAVKLSCSKSTPCVNVEVADIHLTMEGGGATTAECVNIKPKYVGQLVPPACK